jgi:hypothetical protein
MNMHSEQVAMTMLRVQIALWNSFALTAALDRVVLQVLVPLLTLILLALVVLSLGGLACDGCGEGRFIQVLNSSWKPLFVSSPATPFSLQDIFKPAWSIKDVSNRVTNIWKNMPMILTGDVRYESKSVML